MLAFVPVASTMCASTSMSRGANFLSSLIQDVCKYFNLKNVNTSGYLLQTDGLVGRFYSA